MRIRQIKPEFWSDEPLARLPDTVRLFYIGTWQLADDAGFIDWDVPEIGLRLYGYRPRRTRERWVRERAAALENAGRLLLYKCGHGFLPKLTDHQRFGGRPVYTIRDMHARSCARRRAAARPVRAQLRAAARPGKVRVEEVVLGEGGRGEGVSNDAVRDPLRDALGPERTARLEQKAGT